MSPTLLDTATVAMSLNFRKRLYSWLEIPATAWRDRDWVFMAPCITLARSVIVAFQANPLLAAGSLALAANADNYTECGEAELVMFTWRFLLAEKRDESQANSDELPLVKYENINKN